MLTEQGKKISKRALKKARNFKTPSLKSTALQYQKFLVGYQTSINVNTTRVLQEARKSVIRNDAIDDVITEAFSVLGEALASWLSNDLLKAGIFRTARRTSTVNNNKYDKGAYKALGINSVPYGTEQDIIENWMKSNLGLITKTNENQLAALENLFRDNAFSGVRSGQLEAQINKIYNGSKNNVALIARDQTMKLNSQLDRMKQTNAGIEGYYWRGSLDERERLKHVEREGNYYSWDKPPDGGPPGYEFQCRCTAEPALDRALLSKKEWQAEAEKREAEDKPRKEEAIKKSKKGPLNKKRKREAKKKASSLH